MNILALISLHFSFLFFFLGIFIYLKNIKVTLNRIFMILCLSCTWWAFTEFGYRQADSIKEATFWLKLNGFWPLTVALFLHLSLVITEQKKILQRKLSYFFIYLPAFILIAIDSYPAISLSDTIMAPWGCWTYNLNNNIYVWIIQLWSYIVAGVSFFLFLRYYRRSKDYKKKQQIKYVSIALLFPVCTSLLEEFLLPYFGYSVPELIVPGMATAFAFIGYAIWKHELFEITPVTAAEDILSVMSELVILTDEHGTIESINKATLTLTKYSEKELIGKPMSFLFFIREENNELFLKTIENGAYYDEQGWIRAKSEFLIPTSISATIKYDPHKNVKGVVFVARDITERIISQQALQESEEKLRGVLSSLHETFIMVFDYDGNHLHFWASPELNKRYGIENTQFEGKNLKEVFPEDVAAKNIKKIQSIFNSGKPQREEYCANFPKGEFWYDGSFSPMFDVNKKVTSVVAFVRDITEQKKSQEELHKTKELFEKIFLGMDSAIFILNSNIPPEIIDCNPAASQVFGYVKKEILGKTTQFLHVSKKSLEEFQKKLFPAIEKNGFLTLFEFNMKRKDGNVFPTEHSVFPLKDNEGQRIGWVSVVKDITERKKLHEDLLQAEKNASLGTMLSGLAHNLNNPIFLASGRLDLLKNTGELSTKQSDMVKVIEKQIKRIGSLTKEMLELGYSKATEKKEIDLNEIVTSALDTVEKFPLDKKIEFQKELACELNFNANPVEINQIVTNLILNAVDAINKKGAVKIKTYSLDKCSILEIHDYGKGMSEDTLKKVFDPLFTTKTGMAAKGMGMTIVQQFLKRNNGAIEINSLRGKGTTVKISFSESYKKT